jgi:hypothetical protein
LPQPCKTGVLLSHIFAFLGIAAGSIIAYAAWFGCMRRRRRARFKESSARKSKSAKA